MSMPSTHQPLVATFNIRTQAIEVDSDINPSALVAHQPFATCRLSPPASTYFRRQLDFRRGKGLPSIETPS